MYIQFYLLGGSGGASVLHQSIDLWAKKNNIVYKKKVVKYTLRITFEDDKHYSLFALTWQPIPSDKSLYHWQFIEPMNLDNS